jgi:hypothetical protein
MEHYILYLSITLYLIVIVSLARFYQKMISDYKKVYFYVMFQTNYLMYLFSLLIVKYKQEITSFNEFTPLVFAKKKYFFTSTSWSLQDYFELYQSLLEDFHYTEKYINRIIFDPEPTRHVLVYYKFLMSLKPRMWVNWLLLWLMTCGIWLIIFDKPEL